MYGARLVIRWSMIVGAVVGYGLAIDSACAGPTFVDTAGSSDAMSTPSTQLAVASAHDAAHSSRQEALAYEHRSVAMRRDARKVNGQETLALQDVDFRQLDAPSSERVSTPREVAAGASFPQPGSLTAIISTISLALFFFLRRASE